MDCILCNNHKLTKLFFPLCLLGGKFKQSVSLPSTDHRTGVNGNRTGLEDPKGGISYYSNGNLELVCRV